VLAALAAALVPHVQQLSANRVSVVLWAFGRAGFRDQHLLQQLTSRTRHLLQEQQQQQQGQQQEMKLGRAAARQLKLVQFDATALSNTVWGLSALQWHDPQVMAAAASLGGADPLLYEFRPYEAVNLLKGFAAAASAAAQGDADGIGSSSSSSSIADEEAAVHQQVQEEHQPINKEAAAAAAVPDTRLAIQLWPAACAVASAALRRLDEASPQCVVRVMWALAALHQAAAHSQQQQQQQGPPLSAAATQDGRVVFGQLAAALQLQWSRQAAHPVGLTVASWSLVMAQESGLVPALLLQEPGKGSHAAAVLQQLLQATVASAQQQQLKGYQVADLAAAFDRLSRPLQGTGLMQQGGSSIASSSSSSSEASAAAAAAEPSAQSAEGQQLLGQLAAAVAALAGAAQQSAADAAPGQLSVYDVSKMLAAFGRMQVRQAGRRAVYSNVVCKMLLNVFIAAIV
jgi:hypothetical protein